jgi:hypothetical protein
MSSDMSPHSPRPEKDHTVSARELSRFGAHTAHDATSFVAEDGPRDLAHRDHNVPTLMSA